MQAAEQPTTDLRNKMGATNWGVADGIMENVRCVS